MDNILEKLENIVKTHKMQKIDGIFIDRHSAEIILSIYYKLEDNPFAQANLISDSKFMNRVAKSTVYYHAKFTENEGEYLHV